MTAATSSRQNVQLTGPYDSIRDYVAALEARGRLVRIKEMDQDKYEASGFACRLVDKFGINAAPAFLMERVKIEGEWIEGPVLGNVYGGWDMEAMGLGVPDVTDDIPKMYQAAFDKLIDMADSNGHWPRLKPIEVNHNGAPCKEVIAQGDDVDILQYPFIKGNPADGGRYINSGSVIIEDPELGRNIGTYRCQIKEAKKIAVNPEPGQHGWSLLMAAKERGERTVKAAVVLSADPITWTMSSSKIARLGEDEYELAGGLRGKPVELVKCETSDIMVPATAEMIIEGEIPLDQQEEEGPHAEMFGYLGLKRDKNFFMNIHTITHRHQPWLINNFMIGMRGFYTSPASAHAFMNYKKSIPNLVGFHSFDEVRGFTAASIKKRHAGDGVAAGQVIGSTSRFSKVTIIVDDDVDVLNLRRVMHAVGSRWQPHPASQYIRQAHGPLLDPSPAIRGITSKFIIDATRQLPEEGGPPSWPPVSRQLFEDNCGAAFDLVDANWDDYWRDFNN